MELRQGSLMPTLAWNKLQIYRADLTALKKNDGIPETEAEFGVKEAKIVFVSSMDIFYVADTPLADSPAFGNMVEIPFRFLPDKPA